MKEKEIHLRDYLRVIRKRKNTVLTFFFITVIVVIIATFTATPIYRASSSVMIERNTSSPLSGRYRYTPYDPEFLETQYQIIKSASVARKVVENLDAEKMYDIFFEKKESNGSWFGSFIQWGKGVYGSFKKLIGIHPLGKRQAGSEGEGNSFSTEDIELTKAEQIALAVKSGITVEPLQNSRVIEIGYTSKNPALAAKIADSVSQAYIFELLDMRMQVSGYSIKWMTKKAEAQKDKLEKSERALQKYNRDNDIVTIEDKMTVIPERLSGLSHRLTKAETERKSLGSIYSQIKRTKKSRLETIPAIADNRAVASIKEQILTAEQKVTELSKKFGRKHPTMISAKDELKNLKEKKHEEIQRAVQTIKNSYELARSNEQTLRELLQDTKFEASNLNEKYIQQGILKREVETNRHLYNALVTKLKEKGLTEESQRVNVWVLEEASLPKVPVKPNKKRNILLAVILGLFGGVGLAFFFEYLDNTVKSPEDIEDRFDDIPVIGSIDLFRDKKETMVDNLLKGGSSLVAENFSGLRTSILLSSSAGAPKSLLVTSMSPGEGKSSVCACLGISAASAGKKIIVVDADMRRPVQHKMFGLENASGLSTFLANMSTIDIISKGAVDNLSFITSGPVPPNPSELLSGKKMDRLIDKLSEKFDMVIIDSPPLLSTSDPLIISTKVMGTAVVAMAGSTTHEMLNKGVKSLKEINAPLTGFVLNRFDARKSGYYYGYGDYYYYSSEAEPKE